MKFEPNIRHKQYLVFHGYIFMKGSINWRCQNSRKVGKERCPVICTTLNSVFIRKSSIQHIIDDRLVHLPSTQGKKYAMH